MYEVQIWHNSKQKEAAYMIANGIRTWYQTTPPAYRLGITISLKYLEDVSHKEWEQGNWGKKHLVGFPRHIRGNAQKLLQENGSAIRLSEYLYANRTKANAPFLYESQCHTITCFPTKEEYQNFLPSSCVLYGKDTPTCKKARAYYHTYFPFVRFIDIEKHTLVSGHLRILMQESPDGLDSLQAKSDGTSGRRKEEIRAFWEDANREGYLGSTLSEVEREIYLRPYLLRTPVAVNECDRRAVITSEEDNWKRLFPRNQRKRIM